MTNQSTSKILINRKNNFGIDKPKYQTFKMTTIFGQSNSSRKQSKRRNYTEWYLFRKAVGDFSSTTNFNLKSAKNNFNLEYLIMDSTLELIEVDFEHFSLEWV